MINIKRPFNHLLLFALLSASTSAMAFAWGPFTLTGFAKGDLSVSSNQCSQADCQRVDDDGRFKAWTRELKSGAKTETKAKSFTLFQPYLGTRKFHLGKGFKASAILSQRWRDGSVDIEGVVYERNVILEHDYYGFLQLGQFPTRGWSVADFPYGSQTGVADPWGASGAGYGLLTHAVRYALPNFDVFEGDTRVEYTYDIGDEGFNRLKPSFHEFYVQYIKGGLIMDAIFQHAFNGQPGSWAHGPFRGIVNDSDADDLAVDNGLSQNEQWISLLMARYSLSDKAIVYGGIRHNHWSGARAVVVGTADDGNLIWNDMFNTGLTGDCSTTPETGDDTCAATDDYYGASSTDFMLGARYTFNRWLFSTGMVFLGPASTNNPSDNGQDNTLLITNVGASYRLRHDVSWYNGINLARYGKKGIAPLSMPGHSAFSGVDSRISQTGASMTSGLEYVF